MFKKYNSIENTYRSEFLDRIKGHGFWDEEYVVQEKAHGSNLSYWTEDGIHFRSAKRTALLEEKDPFYNHRLLLEESKIGFQNIWRRLKNQYPNLHEMSIFGEVIGGSYPHKEVATDKTAIRVQKGVFYSSQNHFYAFDIYINGSTFLGVDEANALFGTEGLLYAKTLFQGSLEDCLQYSNRFVSTIPSVLGLPPIDDNFCEGVIIKPVRVLRFNNGKRVILKNKNEKWTEKKSFDKAIKKSDSFPKKLRNLQEAIATYATENRLENVLSKIGIVSEKDFGKVMGLFNKDIVEDFTKDYQAVFADLEKKEQKLIKKSLGKIVPLMVRRRLKQ